MTATRILSAGVAALVLALAPALPADAAPPSRSNDPQPHRGGAEIVTTVSGSEFPCTSGFAVRRVEDGKRAMVTAGHCSDARIDVRAQSGEQRYGTFLRSFFDDGADTGLIGTTRVNPQTYAPTIWTDGGTPGLPAARRVLGKADAPVVGQKVCVSGAVTKLVCDIDVGSLTEGVECEPKPAPRRCTRGLARAVREGVELGRGGDSGAPVFVPIDTVIDGHQVHGAMLVGMLVGSQQRISGPTRPNDVIVFHTVKQIECALNVRVLTTAEADSGDTTPPPPRGDCGTP
ncbi:hypothetical protein RB200_41450 [Streptomyces sp. PmtG]